MPRQADAFKVGIESPLGYGIILQSGDNISGDLFSAGEVDQLHGTAVHTVRKQQYFKYGRLYIAIHASFCKGLIAVGLDID